MRISIWPNFLPGNANRVYSLLVSAISKTDEIVEESMEADAALIWSVLWQGKMAPNKKVWDHYRNQDRPVIVAEVGGLVRNQTWRLSINGINRDAIFPKVDLDLGRPEKLNLKLKDWHSGDYILICGQHEKSEQWKNMPELDLYYRYVISEIRKYTDLPIMIRSHPRYRENFHYKIDTAYYKKQNVNWNNPKKLAGSYDDFDLEDILAHCFCTVSHNSNSGISSVLSGTPTIVHSSSLAYPVATNDFKKILDLPRPDRSSWLVELSHKEWFEDELEYAWLNLRRELK